MNSYNTASSALENLNVQLELVRQSREFWFRACIIGSILFVLNCIGKVIMFILWAKRIPVPRWLDILI
jgi:hypothetical protein